LTEFNGLPWNVQLLYIERSNGTVKPEVYIGAFAIDLFDPFSGQHLRDAAQSGLTTDRIAWSIEHANSC
jgi:hypothetical protein